MPIEDEVLLKYIDDDFTKSIKSKSYKSYYQFLINYIDFFKDANEYILNNNHKLIDQLLSDENNKKELEILINYKRFNESLRIYEVLEDNYKANIEKATKEIYENTNNKEEYDKAQLELLKTASIKTIMSYFTSIYKSIEELGWLSLDSYDCILYINGLERLDELINKEINTINRKNDDT